MDIITFLIMNIIYSTHFSVYWTLQYCMIILVKAMNILWKSCLLQYFKSVYAFI